MYAPVDVTSIYLETERLILRPWQERDLEDFYEYAQVDGVGQMAGWEPHSSMQVSRQILELFLREKKTLALVEKQRGKVISSLGLERREEPLNLPDGTQGREIGYVLSKAYWGQGLMPEAVKAAAEYCFRELAFDWLTCGHFSWNSQSRRVIEKCGFVYWKDMVFHTQMGTDEPGKLWILWNPNKVR